MGDGHEHEEVATAAVEAAERPLLRGAPSSFDGVLALQRIIGNAGVSRLVAARRPKLTVARLVDPGSPEYLRGYNEGRGNQDANPGMLVGDALESYNEGYRRGKDEAESSKTSSPPGTPAPETPAPGVKFANADLQNVYDANKPGTPDQLAALRLLDSERKGVWAKITWATVAKSAAARVYNPNMMSQGDLGTCGPATILNFLGTNDPQSYALLVIEVYRDGKGRGSKVNEKLRAKDPLPGMDAVDWMMMSAVQDIQNDWYDYYGTPEGQEEKREGTSSGDQRWMYKKFANVEDAKTIDTPKHDDVLPAARKVNGLVGTPGVSINMHLSASVLKNPASAENARNHVIRLLRPISITENADDAKSVVEFDAFTWGKVFHWKGTVNQFIHMMWAFTIASTKKGVI